MSTPTTQPALAASAGSAEHFILSTRPGKIPTVKGPYPLTHVAKSIVEIRSANPDATLTVCHVVGGPRLWAISEAEWMFDESPNSGMNDSQSHQPSMTSEQLDRFQDWLNREAVEANNKSGAYFNGRACAFNDAFECLAILRMKASQTPESTETDKSQSAS